MQKFIIATKNAKKLKELDRVLRPLKIEAVTEKELGICLDEVEETGQTFSENAFLKAESACKKTGLPAVADDSGLCVDALGGRPGIYSARYAGENATDKEKIEKLLSELKNVKECDRTARFVSCVCCVWPDGRALNVRGECEGVIAFEPDGEGGFGYDPVFLVDGKSFASLSPVQKDAVSHRGRALRVLSERLKEYI